MSPARGPADRAPYGILLGNFKCVNQRRLLFPHCPALEEVVRWRGKEETDRPLETLTQWIILHWETIQTLLRKPASLEDGDTHREESSNPLTAEYAEHREISGSRPVKRIVTDSTL